MILYLCICISLGLPSTAYLHSIKNFVFTMVNGD